MSAPKPFDGRTRASDSLRKEARNVLAAPQDTQNHRVFMLAILCDDEGVNVLKLLDETRMEFA